MAIIPFNWVSGGLPLATVSIGPEMLRNALFAAGSCWLAASEGRLTVMHAVTAGAQGVGGATADRALHCVPG